MDQSVAASASALADPPNSLHQLASQHSQIDARIQNLARKRYLTAEEQIECQRLKKLKLQLKDEMEQLRRAAAC